MVGVRAVTGPMTAGPTFQAVSAQLGRSRRPIAPANLSSTMSDRVGVGRATAADDLFQTGFDQDCTSGRPVDYAWWDRSDPRLSRAQFLFNVNSGDVV